MLLLFIIVLRGASIKYVYALTIDIYTPLSLPVYVLYGYLHKVPPSN